MRDAGSSAERMPFFEVLLLFVLASVAVGFAAVRLGEGSDRLHGLWLHLLLPAVALWPWVRGVSPPELTRGLGLRRSAGFGREVGFGLLAYVASWPILAVGLGASLLLQELAPPHHPAVDWLRDAQGSDLLAVAVVVVLWMPLAEELVFRGALHHFLRGSLGFWGAAGLGSAIFALLHPQGPAAWPFLATLGVVLAWIRERRGSIAGCVALHCIHNAMTLALMAVLMR